MYSDLYFRQKKSFVPVLIAVLAIIGVTSFLTFYFSSSSTPTRASQKALLQREIVNPNSTQAGIFWESDEMSTGFVLYGTDPNKLNTSAHDVRDTDKKSQYKLHYVLLDTLKPNTNYYYRIVNNNQVSSDNDGSPFVFKTANSITGASDAQPAYGKVTLKSGGAADNTFVILKSESTYPLLAITKSTGEWLIPMQYVISKGDNAAILLKPSDAVTLEMMNDDGLKTTIQLKVEKLSPLPQTVVLGNSYKFTNDQNVLSATTSYETETKSGDINILFPKQKAVIPGAKPLIKGTAVPGASVDLELNSQPKFSFSTQANDRGEWIINVPKPLPPREYTLALSTKDKDGKPVILARTFTIAKSGEQVLGEATDAATPTIAAPTTAVSPAVEPTLAVTATPEATKIPAEVTPSASASATATPSAMPVITSYTGPSPDDGGPRTGGNGFMYTVVSLGLLVVGAGVFFFL